MKKYRAQPGQPTSLGEPTKWASSQAVRLSRIASIPLSWIFFLLILVTTAWSQPRGHRPPEPSDSPPLLGGQKIAWYATWEMGLAAAQRANRPILLVAAAPQCHGVSGVW